MGKIRKQRRRGFTRLSRKNQVTIPVDVLRRAGLKPGDELRVQADDAGRIVLERYEDMIVRYAGSMPGVYPKGYLKKIRAEWDV